MINTILVAALAALCPIAPKTVAHVDVLDAQTVVVCYADASMAVGPLSSFSPSGEVLAGQPITTIETTGGDQVLIDEWVTVDGTKVTVRTSCVTWTPQDCIAAHMKLLNLRKAASPPVPQPKPIDK